MTTVQQKLHDSSLIYLTKRVHLLEAPRARVGSGGRRRGCACVVLQSSMMGRPSDGDREGALAMGCGVGGGRVAGRTAEISEWGYGSLRNACPVAIRALKGTSMGVVSTRAHMCASLTPLRANDHARHQIYRMSGGEP